MNLPSLGKVFSYWDGEATFSVRCIIRDCFCRIDLGDWVEVSVFTSNSLGSKGKIFFRKDKVDGGIVESRCEETLNMVEDIFAEIRGNIFVVDGKPRGKNHE